MEADGVGARAESVEVGLGLVPVAAGARERPLAAPCEHVHPERAPVAGDERSDRAVAHDAEDASVQLPADRRLPAARAERDGVVHHEPRVAASSSASVSSAGAYGAPEPAQTAIPRRVQASRSMCGMPRPVWQMSRKAWEELEQRFVDRRPLADEDDCLGVADLCRPRLGRLGALRVDDDVVPGEEREASSRSTARW